jgi:hypothetical protein
MGANLLKLFLATGDYEGPCESLCFFNAGSCDDGDSCTTDVCKPNGACSNQPVECGDGGFCVPATARCETCDGNDGAFFCDGTGGFLRCDRNHPVSLDCLPGTTCVQSGDHQVSCEADGG